ncbi:L,D-transpeptidase [Haloechinothrix sp. YIM 98757]|uniref:L,D-transpeptidase n=2 Tax=Haloechinothrix aidingensis TaxID=2752311 RepID=A0A837ZYS7_9PSEU|nr:L,D-transpeptidase [Haloechinothrix aidingensis]
MIGSSDGAEHPGRAQQGEQDGRAGQPGRSGQSETGTDTVELVDSTTHTTVEGAPVDPAPRQGTDGIIVHPLRPTPVHAEPGGEAIARMTPTQISDTWLPVIDERDGWVRVLLPSRPNGSTGWLRGEDLERAFTPYTIRVHLESMTLRLLFRGDEIGSWPIGIGKADTPTPAGRTFLLGSFTDAEQQFSPVILPLGSHSDTLDDFGGGPGTVAIHTWPTEDVLGTATSHGCIRVPRDALDRLTEVPLGTLVLVDQQ